MGDCPRVTKEASTHDEHLYGYGWWIGAMADLPVYFAWGSGGQYIFAIPAVDLVVVTTSSVGGGEDRRGQHHAVYDLVERFIVQPVACSGGR